MQPVSVTSKKFRKVRSHLVLIHLPIGLQSCARGRTRRAMLKTLLPWRVRMATRLTSAHSDPHATGSDFHTFVEQLQGMRRASIPDMFAALVEFPLVRMIEE